MTIHSLNEARPAPKPPAARQAGPVTFAIRAVRPRGRSSWDLHALQIEAERRSLAALRRRIAAQIEEDQTRIERCLAALDMLDGDPDFEPSMGFVPAPYLDEAEGDERGRDLDLEPSLCGIEATAYRQDIFSIDLEEDELAESAIAGAVCPRQAL